MALEQSEMRSHPIPRGDDLPVGSESRSRSAFPFDLPHVVVCTQDLARVSPMIQVLIAAGYMVTAYPSASRLLPRLHKIPHPIELLVIDGSDDVPFARSALLRARAAFEELPIVLLSHPETDLGLEAAHLGATRVVYMPLEKEELLSAAFSLAPSAVRAAATPCC
jgi:PleD family two-component response regulator